MIGAAKMRMVLSSVQPGPPVPTCQPVDDTFTGVNGSPPDALLWSIYNPNGVTAGIANIQSNKLQINTTDTSAVGQQQLPFGVESIHVLTGDFDIEIEMSEVSTPAGISEMVLECDGEEVGMRTNGATKEWFTSIDNWDAPRASTFGKVRLVRVGTTISSYYKDGNDATWTLFGSIPCSGNDLPYYVWNAVRVDGNTDQVISDADNFILNSGCAILPLGPYVTEVMALNPLAYWRFNETDNSQPMVDETGNYNGYYNDPNNDFVFQQQSLVPSEPGAVSIYNSYQTKPTAECSSIASKLSTLSTGSIVMLHKYGVDTIRFATCGASNNVANADLNQLYVTHHVGNVVYVYFRFTDGGDYGLNNFRVQTVNSINANHIVVVQDDVEFVKIYANGVLQATTNNAVVQQQPVWFSDLPGLAIYSPTGVATNDPYGASSWAYIAESTLFETQLTDQQTLNLYNASQL